MPVTALDAAGKLALQGVLAEKHGRYELAPDVQEDLTDYFVARGKGVMRLPWDVDKANDAAWEAEWRAYVLAAGITDATESLILIEWLRARSAPGSGASKQGGKTRLVM